MNVLFIRNYLVVVVIGVLGVLSASAVSAQTATNLNCNGCVGPGEIRNNSVSWGNLDAVAKGFLINQANTVNGFDARLTALEATINDPVEITVVCADGDTVTAALDSVAATTPVTITIQGTCTEQVLIERDHVTLIGSTPADGIAAPADFCAVCALTASHISLQSLTLSGGGNAFGLGCSDGSEVNASDITFSGAGLFVGVIALTGGLCVLENSTIDGSQIALVASLNSHVSVLSSVIENSTFAAMFVTTNSSLVLDAVFSPPGSPANPASILTNNATGGSVSTSSSIQLRNAIIELSNGTGLDIQPGGTVFVNLGDTAIIRNNVGDGLRFSANTSALFFSAGLDISNNGGFGVNCDAGDNAAARANVSILGAPGSISGNTSGNFSANCP